MEHSEKIWVLTSSGQPVREWSCVTVPYSCDMECSSNFHMTEHETSLDNDNNDLSTMAS